MVSLDILTTQGLEERKDPVYLGGVYRVRVDQAHLLVHSQGPDHFLTEGLVQLLDVLGVEEQMEAVQLLVLGGSDQFLEDLQGRTVQLGCLVGERQGWVESELKHISK